jgi:hypothetical protein
MKTRSIAVAGLIFLLSAASFPGNAQESSSPVIKVLPTAATDALKLLVTQDEGTDVEVNFYDEHGSIAHDEISAEKGGNGFLKRYDFQKLPKDAAFWMSVKTSNTSVVFRITRSSDRLDAQLTETTHTYPVIVAAR